MPRRKALPTSGYFATATSAAWDWEAAGDDPPAAAAADRLYANPN